MGTFFRRLRARLRYRRFDRDLAEELAFHRDMKHAELAPDSIDDANRPERTSAVDRSMGNELLMRERARDVWVPPSLDALRQDVRDACRLLVRRPLFTAASVAALVLGVGAATLAYSLASALLFRPLPVDRPEELAYLSAPSFSYPIVQEVRAQSSFFADAFGWTLEQYDTAWGTEAERSLVLAATGNIHQVLGVKPSTGRLLTSDDDRPGVTAVGVLSFATWQQRFGGQPSALGAIVRVRGVPVTIVGVTPPGFFGVAPGRLPEMTVPVSLVPQLTPEDGDVLGQRGRAWLHVMGRLAPGVSLAAANTQFRVVWPQILEATADPKEAPERRARFLSRESSLADGRAGYSSVRNQYRQPLLILAALTALLWLVGCVTVANLLIAGAWGRSRELAVRLALGCGRARIARQLLIEGLVLASIAALVAVVLSRWAAGGLVSLIATSANPVVLDFVVDNRLALFIGVLVVASALVFSVAPMMLALRLELGPALKAGSRTVAAHGRILSRVLVSTQSAVSVVLLISAALLLRSFGHLVTTDPGFDARQLLIAELDPSTAHPSQTERVAAPESAADDALDRVARVPGIASASVAMYPPISHEDGSWTQTIGVDDRPPVESGATTFFNAVGPNYFATTGTRLIAGREFSAADANGAERVAIINESLAASAFGQQSPLGHRITIGRNADRRSLTIVGVVADATYQRLQEAPRAIAYLPHRQTTEALTGRPVFVVARVVQPSSEVTDALREALAGSNPIGSVRVEPLANRIRDSLVTERILAVLAAGLAGCALLLACAGLFGLLMHLVARRTREIGVRMALGARTADVVRPVIGHALGLAAIGLGIGASVAWAGAGVIRSVLHGIEPDDPIAYGGVALLTLLVSAAAGLLPARRAARVNPIEALRME